MDDDDGCRQVPTQDGKERRNEAKSHPIKGRLVRVPKGFLECRFRDYLVRGRCQLWNKPRRSAYRDAVSRGRPSWMGIRCRR